MCYLWNCINYSKAPDSNSYSRIKLKCETFLPKLQNESKILAHPHNTLVWSICFCLLTSLLVRLVSHFQISVNNAASVPDKFGPEEQWYFGVGLKARLAVRLTKLMLDYSFFGNSLV